MELRGQQHIPVGREQVWKALNDPQILKECIAGCEAIDLASDNEFVVRLVAAVGPVKAKFQGRILLSDLNPPSSYKLTFEGQGGMAGFAKGGAEVSLASDNQGTLLTYVSKAQVGGKLAQVGSRLIEGAARKVAEDFFSALVNKLTKANEDENNCSVVCNDPSRFNSLPLVVIFIVLLAIGVVGFQWWH